MFKQLKKKKTMSMGAMLGLAIVLLLIGSTVGKARQRKLGKTCDSRSSLTKVMSGTNMSEPKYSQPGDGQANVVVRRSIALLTSRGR